MSSYPPWPPNSGSPSSHPSAYPPPPPPVPPPTAQNMVMPPELQALNITPQQMAALFSHLQAGTIPFPPPPPPPPQSYTPAAPYQKAPIPTQLDVHNGAVPNLTGLAPNGSNPRMDVDREEGEVSDVSQSQHGSPPALSASKKRKLRASAKKSPLAQSTQVQTAHQAADVSVSSLAQKKAAVLPFVAALHKEGFAFSEFVREGLDESLLRQVYEELRIPVPAAQSKEQAAASAPTTIPTSTSVQSPASANTSAPKPSEVVKAPISAKPAAPMSRQDYLARLQAAKTKKSDSAAAAAAAAAAATAATTATDAASAPAKQPAQLTSSDAPAPSSSAAALVRAPNTTAPSTTTTPTPGPTPAPTTVPKKQSQTTELVRKKIEALKATQRRLASNGSSAPTTPSTQALSQPGDQTAKRSSVQPTPTALQPQGGIPGLFMSVPAKSPLPESGAQSSLSESASVSVTSVAPTAASKSATPQPTNVVSFPSAATSRKRPVASDLNEAYTAQDQRPFKRPFGQSRQNSSDDVMIIVTDEEESSGGDDDDDDEEEVSNKVTIREKNIRDLPPLRDFPQRPVFNRQHTTFTPPLGTPGISNDAEELKRKEQEITTLNLRIKEAELRKAALRAKAQLPQSQPQTPSGGTPVFGRTQPQLSAVADKARTGPVSTPISSPAILKSEAKPSPARRAEIEAHLSACELKKSTSEARIQELQKQIAEIQRGVQESEEKQRRLREELESLDVNTDGMTQSDMEAKKQEIDDLRDVEHNASTGTLESNSPRDTVVQPAPREHAPQPPHPRKASCDDLSQAPTTQAANTFTKSMSEGVTDTSSTAAGQEHQPEETQQEQPHTSPFQPDTDSDESSSMSESTGSGDDENQGTTSRLTARPGLAQEHMPDASPDSENDSAMDEASSTSESTHSQEDNLSEELVWLYCRNIPYDSTKDDIRPIFEGFDVNIHAPRRGNQSLGNCFVRIPRFQAEEAKTKLHGSLLKGRKLIVQIARRAPPQELLSPEPSGKPEQKPASPESDDDDDDDDDDEMDISESSSSDEDEEVEVGQSSLATSAGNLPRNGQASVASSRSEHSADTSDEENDNEDQDRMDLESQLSSASSADAAAVPDLRKSQPQTNGTNAHEVADDLAPELQAGSEQQTKVSEAINSEAPGVSDCSFVPYQSVLKRFKGYRFHPDYSKEVQGGYHSLTYSHQIDPHKELCRYEVASGVCNDHSCEYQHFRDMAVTDNDIIMQMATDFARRGRDAEEVEQFKAGLATVLQQLQNEGNTDTETLAARVAQYRRDFNQDPTSILGL